MLVANREPHGLNGNPATHCVLTTWPYENTKYPVLTVERCVEHSKLSWGSVDMCVLIHCGVVTLSGDKDLVQD